MIVIGSRGDLGRLNGTDPAIARFIIDELVPEIEASAEEDGRDWDPDDHGIFIVVEGMGDLHRDDVPACYGGPGDEHWEYVSYHQNAEIFLAETGTNQVVGAVIPDAPWLDRGVRSRLMEAAGITGGSDSKPPSARE